jgi:CDP-glucose 4,6-dehydratase
MIPLEFLEILKNTFGSRRVFVTGHTGFKGSWLALWLIQLGAEVTGYALEQPTTPNMFEAIGLREKISHIHGDVRDYDHLRRSQSCRRTGFHLAAQPGALLLPGASATYETSQGQ